MPRSSRFQRIVRLAIVVYETTTFWPNRVHSRNLFASPVRKPSCHTGSLFFWESLSNRVFLARPMGSGGPTVSLPLAFPNEGEKRADPEDHALLVVRSPGGRGGGLLYLDFSELEGRQGGPLRRGGSRTGRLGDDRANFNSRGRRSSPSMADRTSSSPRRSRLSSIARRRRKSIRTGKNFPPAARGPMRLAEGQVRFVVADRADRAAQAVGRSRPGKSAAAS